MPAFCAFARLPFGSNFTGVFYGSSYQGSFCDIFVILCSVMHASFMLLVNSGEGWVGDGFSLRFIIFLLHGLLCVFL